MRYLITQSLLGSWGYLFSCMEEYHDQAYEDFLTTLRREKKETTPEMQNGIDFENLVYEIAEGLYQPELELGDPVRAMGDTVITQKYSYHKWYNGAKAVATVIKGAQVQVKASRELTVAGMDFLVYGILDALKAGSIYDVKFLNKSFGSAELAGKYLESPQHHAYFYLIPEAVDFTYLVSDGQDLYTERYTPDMCKPFPDIVSQFIASITSMGLLDVYKEHWQAL